MSYCADINILLRWVHPGTSAGEQARSAIKTLRAQGETVYITPQNLVKFWSVATRPVNVNGLELTPEEANVEATKLESLFPLLLDTSAIHPEWRRLVVETKTMGTKCHDARITTALRIHGVAKILTFNVDDFKGFEGVSAISLAKI